MLGEFRAFLLRGNVIDLAVAVVIGAAFGAVITSLVENIITPIIGVFGGIPDFSALSFTINGSEFGIGLFINALLAFVVIAAVIFFVVVIPMNRLMARMNPADEPTPMRECPYCLSSIPPAASRCAHCTQEVTPEPAG